MRKEKIIFATGFIFFFGIVPLIITYIPPFKNSAYLIGFLLILGFNLYFLNSFVRTYMHKDISLKENQKNLRKISFVLYFYSIISCIGFILALFSTSISGVPVTVLLLTPFIVSLLYFIGLDKFYSISLILLTLFSIILLVSCILIQTYPAALLMYSFICYSVIFKRLNKTKSRPGFITKST